MVDRTDQTQLPLQGKFGAGQPELIGIADRIQRVGRLVIFWQKIKILSINDIAIVDLENVFSSS